MLKNIVIIILFSITFALGAFSFVFGGNLVFNPELRFVGASSDSIYLDPDTPAKAILVYSSNFDISGASLQSLCSIEYTFVDSYKDFYFFEIDYSGDLACKNGGVAIQIGEDIYANTMHSIDLIQGADLFHRYIDFPNSALFELKDEFDKQIRENTIFKNYNSVNIAQNFRYYKGKVAFQNAQLHHRLISTILDGRQEKYLTPVLGREFSDLPTKLPNSPRPYRSSYTDGIHRGFDIDGAFGDIAIALDTGIVVRVVDGFNNQTDFSRIVYGEDLTYEQELKNLDVLRGNQVWIKTLKGEVVFYSHLDTIHDTISQGDLIVRGDKIGTTGITGVPGEGYDDYHLHFAVMKNPYDILRAGSYDFGDYMIWDWLGKGMTYQELLQLKIDTFE